MTITLKSKKNSHRGHQGGREPMKHRQEKKTGWAGGVGKKGRGFTFFQSQEGKRPESGHTGKYRNRQPAHRTKKRLKAKGGPPRGKEKNGRPGRGGKKNSGKEGIRGNYKKKKKGITAKQR